MAVEIDHKVVEMRFDNKQFEKDAGNTIGTLSRLKEALKLPDSTKALEGIDKAARNVSLDGIAAGVDALNRRFSNLGIVGMRVIENITDGLMNKVGSAINFVTDSIVSGGIKRAMNIENAHFQLQALLKDETKVQAVMDNAMESVDGTAYAYDEAAKAASQFAASGLEAGEEMLSALKGITGVAAMTNSEYEGISRIFTTVAGQGRLMGDQLLQLSSRGMNAAATLADYFVEVRGQAGMTEAEIRDMVSKGKISFKDFSEAMTWAFGDSAKRANETFTGAMSNMKSALARIGAGFVSPLIEQNGELVQLFNALRIKINDIKSALVFDEQKSAISGLAKVTGITNEEMSEMFSTIKSNGKVTMEDLDKMTEKGANATNALLNYIRGVESGRIRASYSIKSSLDELTNGTKISREDLKRFVEEGKIDLATFTAAMENQWGNQRTLSKQFTDFFLDQISKIVDAVNSADMTKPMEIFYYWVESVKNVLKGLLSVLQPVGRAFSEVFLDFNSDDILSVSEAIEDLTSKLKLSEKNSENLHDAMKGLFDVAKLGIDIFVKLVGAIIPINKPVMSMGDSFLDLAGYLGRSLSEFTNFIRNSRLIKKAYDTVSKAIEVTTKALSDFVINIADFIESVYELPIVQTNVNKVLDSFKNMDKIGSDYLVKFIDRVKELKDSLAKMIPDDFSINIDWLERKLSGLSAVFKNLTDIGPLKFIEDISDRVKELYEILMENEGFNAFVTNMKEYGEDIKEAFTFDSLTDTMEALLQVTKKFVNFIKETVGPAFEEFNLGGAIATGGSIGMIVSIFKMAKALDKIGSSFHTIPEVINGFLTPLKTVANEYQKEIKANVLLKVAAAISALAISLVFLSFADPDRLILSAMALTILSGAILFGTQQIMEAVNKSLTLEKGLNTIAIGLKRGFTKLGRAVEIKAIGSAMKDLAEALAIVVGTLSAFSLLYKQDAENVKESFEIIKVIVEAMIGIIVVMSVLGKFVGSGMKSFSVGAIGIVAIAFSLQVVISAMDKLFNMDFPSDWESKVEIIRNILLGLSALSIVLAYATKISGGGKFNASPLISIAASLYITVFAMDKLFHMDFPSDWKEKMGIIAAIFGMLSIVLVAMGVAARIAGGSIKAGGTILATAILLVAVVGSLKVLADIPADKLLTGVVALGAILIALSVTLAGAGTISSSTNYKSVTGMAIVIAVLTGALGLLSMIPVKQLAKASIALGGILLTLAVSFSQAGKMNNDNVAKSLLSMIAVMGAITVSLYFLAKQPWDSLLAAGASLSAVLIAMSEAFNIVLKKNWSNNTVKKIGTFLLLTVSLIPITAALAVLAHQPLDGMLAAVVAINAVMIGLIAVFATISAARNVSIKGVGLFLLMTTSLIPIGIAIGLLANSASWENLLSIGATISAVLLSMVAAMAVCTIIGNFVGPAVAGILLLDAFIANFVLVLVALGKIFESPEAQALLSGGLDILVQLGQGIGDFIGSIVNGVLTKIASGMPQIASDLSLFMDNLQGFISGSNSLNSDAIQNVLMLSEIIKTLSNAEIVNGIASLFNLSLADLGTELSEFMVALMPFIVGSLFINKDSMLACSYLGDMIGSLTKAELISGISNMLGIGNNLTDFANQLTDFAPAIVDFASQVNRIDPESVKGAAAATEIIATSAEKLPGRDGLMQKIFGRKSLSDFANQLKNFGPAIVDFANTVKGLDPSSVEGAAAAADIMSEVANNLPAQDSLINKIFGDKSLKQFGEELEAFGPSILRFSIFAAPIKKESVDGVSRITRIMSTLANDLPTEGGFLDLIFGKQMSLSEFSKDLLPFGENMKAFSDTVKDIDPNSVLGVAAITSIFENIAKLLPTQASFIQSIASEDGITMSFSTFGKEIEKLGNSMKKFSDKVSDIDTSNISKIVIAVRSLLRLSNEIAEGSPDALSNFASGLGNVGLDSVNSFISAFLDADTRYVAAVNYVVAKCKMAFENKYQEFIMAGRKCAVNWIDGVKDKYPSVTLTANTMITKALNAIRSKVEDFYTVGVSCVNRLRTAFYESYPSFTTIGESLVSNVLAGVSSKEGEFATLGEKSALSYISGISSKIADSEKAGRDLAEAAYNAAIKALDEHSPSKKMGLVGENAGLGFINSLIDFIAEAWNVGEKIGSSTLEGAKSGLSNLREIVVDISDPVIKPSMDLSEIKSSARDIQNMFNNAIRVSTSLAASTNESFNDVRRKTNQERRDNLNLEGGSSVTFVQNNYSPKALDRMTIYRDSRNLIRQQFSGR